MKVLVFVLFQLVCISLAYAYPSAFQYPCYYHPHVGGSTYVCPIPPTNCTRLSKCKNEMQAIFNITPFVGVTPTK